MSKSPATTWIVESGIFPARYQSFVGEVQRSGSQLHFWRDDWWRTGAWPTCDSSSVVFHGSLGNAARVSRELPWKPGAFCDAEAFACSAWYPRAKRWLLHDLWVATTAESLVASPAIALDPLGASAEFFVRPDSPLKPFSGRVVRADGLTLESLDYGFYFDDASLPVVACPVRQISREWRYVVVDCQVVAGSAYQADGREAREDDPRGSPWRFAESVAKDLTPPESVYVLDVCESGGSLSLLELNPFSGADLYACDAAAVVREVNRFIQRGSG
ncbi:MAG: ATP-grasp domain-containing protein [Planctomycetota bacterium]